MLPDLYNNAMSTPVSRGPINRMDSLFDHVFGEDGAFSVRAWSAVPVAMWEDADHYSIEAELPGMADKDVDLTVHNGVLTIRGERKPEEGRRYLYNGRPYGRFEQAIALPEDVNTDEVQATMRDGVLRVDLPKRPEAKPRKIELKTS